MTIQQHIEHHVKKIDHLYDERDRIQYNIHRASGENTKITVEELFYYTKTLTNIDRELRASIDIRLTLMAIQGLKTKG